MNCIVCDEAITELNDSDEHVIANAIGGRLKVSGVVCRVCNPTTGRDWDSVLAEQLHPLSMMFAIKRERGAVPNLKATTVQGDEIYIRSDGSLQPVATAPITYEESGQKLMRLTVTTMEEAREVLEKLKARRYPKLDVEKELAAAQEQWTFNSVFKFQLGLGGLKSGRAMVKSALTWAAANKVEARFCENALRYLRDSEASPPYGFYFERDLIAGRSERTPLHCVAVSSRENDGQLLAYVEYFGVHRVVVLLSDRYEGPDIHCAYAIDPNAGRQLDLEFEIRLSRHDMQRCFDYQCLPKGAQEAAFHNVMPLAMQINQKRAIHDLAGRAARYAFANCGAKPGELLTDEQMRKLGPLVAQYVLRLAKIRAVPAPGVLGQT
jgi:hypothetical protein